MVFIILSVLHELCLMEVVYHPILLMESRGFVQVHSLACKWIKVQALVPGLP